MKNCAPQEYETENSHAECQRIQIKKGNMQKLGYTYSQDKNQGQADQGLVIHLHNNNATINLWL